MIDIQSPTIESAVKQPVIAPKVLFADDSKDLREAIEMVLFEEGYQVQTAGDGSQAVALFDQFQPDLVILDIHMPFMNGSDACAVIRQISDVPIIMFTSDDSIVNVTTAVNNGATDFILKSSGVTRLIERVAFHLAKKNEPVHSPLEGALV